MLDSLFELFSELSGTPKKQAQRRAAPQSRQRDEPDAQPGNTRAFDDLVRQFFGLPAEEPVDMAETPPAPAAPPPPRIEQPPPPIRTRPAATAQQTITGTFDAAYGNVAPDVPAPLAGAEGANQAAKGPTGRELAERLRTDPAAARAAFVYSEIFGPPKADRLHGD